MKFEIPKPLQVEHEELHARLVEATKAPGAAAEAAREVARLLHPHFVREEEFALPPLAVLEKLARERATAEMAAVLPMTRRLEAELPQMLSEHKLIVSALDKLRAAARVPGHRLQGASVDLVQEGLARRLRFDNPNAHRHCGCGESFSVTL